MKYPTHKMAPQSRLAGMVALVVSLLLPMAVAAQEVGHWEPRASMPLRVDEPRGVSIDNKIYILGGIDDTGMGPLGVVLVYDDETDSWEERAKMPTPGHHLMVSKYKGKIYVFGGFDLSDTVFAWRAIDNAWEYSPDTDTWKALPPMPAGPRGAGEAVEVDGKIYVIGGAGPLPGQDPAMEFNGTHAVVGTTEVYDIASNSWSTVTAMPTARNHFHASATNGKIYAFGGRVGSAYIVHSSNTDIVEEYNPETDSWTLKKPMPTNRSGTGGAPYNGKIYVAGGEYQSDVMMAAFRVLEAYDPATNSWNTSLPRMLVPRHGFVGILMNNEFHVLGGGFQSAGVDRVVVTTETHDAFIFAEDPVAETQD